MGLSDNYTDVRGQVFKMTPLPSITKAVSMLVQEEGQRQCVNSMNLGEISTTLFSKTGNTITSNFSNNNGGYRNNRSRVANNNNIQGSKGTFFCNYCHGDSHSKDRCFYLHGFSDWHPLHGTKPDLSKMPKYKGKGKSLHTANAASIQGSNSNSLSGSSAITSNNSSSCVSNAPITHAQYQ